MSIGNQVKTAMLLAALTGLLLLAGSFWGYSGLTVAFIFAIAMNIGSYWFSDKIVLWIYKAKEINEKGNPGLFRIVRDVSKSAGIPLPKVCIINSQHSNAFATGRSPKHAAIACTTGILELLDEDELKGVIAHEISHIKNRDTLIQSISATIAGVISYVAFMARWAAIFGGFGKDDDGPNMLELLVLAVLTPILAAIIQLAISRSREYLADASAANTLHDGKGLASALKKLDADIAKKPLRAMSTTETTAHLMVANPFGKGGFLTNLFSTHPPMEKRIKRLNEMRF